MKEDILGLSVISSEYIKCGDCGIKLVDIVLIETNEGRVSRGLKPQTTIYKIVNCPQCGGSSFLTPPYEGSTIIGASIDGYFLESEDSEILDNDDIFVTAVLRKK